MNRKEFIVLVATTCLVIITWVISDIYHTKANVQILPTLQHALEPMDPNFDQTTIEQVKKLNSSQIVIPEPTPISVKIVSPNPTPTAEPPQTASPSASTLPL